MEGATFPAGRSRRIGLGDGNMVGLEIEELGSLANRCVGG